MANQTPDDSTNHHPTTHHLLVPQLVSLGVIAVITVIGNFLICWIEITRKPRKRSGYFIINLAVSDLAVGLLSIPLEIVELLSSEWPFFAFMCNVVYPFQTILMAVSVITLLCMSVERNRAIITPFKSKPSGGLVVRVVLAVWVVSVLLVIPYTLVLKIKDDSCVEDWPSQDHVKAYTVIVFIVLYLLPLTLITMCYTNICIFLCKEERRWKSMTMYCGQSIRRVRRISNTRHKQNVKMIKAFVAAVMAFSICQLPNHVIWLWHDFGTGSQWKHLDDVLPFCHVLTYLNSAIDPFIFGSLDAEILRQKVRTALRLSKRQQNGALTVRSALTQESKNKKRKGTQTRVTSLLRTRSTKRRSSTMESEF